MALSISMTGAVGRLAKPGMRIASFGYPDIIAPITMIERILGDKMAQLEYRADSNAICKRHSLPQRKIPDAESFFRLLDCKLVVYDVVKERGCEVILDLNHRIDPILRAFNYDMALDVGTLEHCFNIAQAAINMAGMLKQGGYILHENPFNWGNHGLYGLNPTWYHDFYEANGFTVLECRAAKDIHGTELPATGRFVFVDTEINLFTVAQRSQVRGFVYPTQTKYKKKLPVAGVPGEQLKEVENV